MMERPLSHLHRGVLQMKSHHVTRLVILACGLLAVPGVVSAGEIYGGASVPVDNVALPKPAEVQGLTVNPAKVTLKGADDSMQLVVTAALAGGKEQDLSNVVIDSPTKIDYKVSDAKIVKVTPSGRVIPLADGNCEIAITYGDKSAKVPVTVSHTGESLPINFGNQVVPIFTKLGCNSGGCHGKASGQNGFKLSLLGFEPEVDYTSLVKEARGRRLFPAAPENSLLLLKATGVVPHGGGKKFDRDSDEYRLIRRWISAGMPFGKPNDPVVTKISVFPGPRVLSRHNMQQIAAYAHYSDGSVEDITRRAQYESNDTEIANVDVAGLVRTQEASGEAAIMVRYLGQVTVYRATVPLGKPIPNYNFPQTSPVVDANTHKKYQHLGLVPSELCDDATFIRRAMLDICGTLPTPAEVTAFVTDQDGKKRDRLIDSLVERPEYSYYFGSKWADILRVKRRNQPNRAQGTFAFHHWIREAMAEDKPYDQFVREIVAASGDEYTHPPSVWYKELSTGNNQNIEQTVDDVSQVFLGLRIACAQCHHHPYEKWSQDDYWGMGAFFARVGRKALNEPGGFQNQQNQRQRVFVRSAGTVNNKRTNQPAKIKALDAEPMEVAAGDDPRQKLVDWMIDANNPFFAKAVVNRYWAHFFGRGIVDPLDDMRVTNPPSNPELLDALAKDFIANRYSLKHLVKTIAKSRTYQLSSVPNEFNKQDKQNYARFYPRRMSAEVLLDALCQVTDSPTQFPGVPTDTNAPRRAIMLPDESFASYFLDVFGRPQRISACECERVNEANLAQALHLLNSEEVIGKINRANARVDQMAKDTTKDDRAKIEELVLWCFARKPTPEEFQAALDHIAKKGPQNKKVAYEDLLYVLINCKEFVFND